MWGYGAWTNYFPKILMAFTIGLMENIYKKVAVWLNEFGTCRSARGADAAPADAAPAPCRSYSQPSLLDLTPAGLLLTLASSSSSARHACPRPRARQAGAGRLVVSSAPPFVGSR